MKETPLLGKSHPLRVQQQCTCYTHVGSTTCAPSCFPKSVKGCGVCVRHSSTA